MRYNCHELKKLASLLPRWLGLNIYWMILTLPAAIYPKYQSEIAVSVCTIVHTQQLALNCHLSLQQFVIDKNGYQKWNQRYQIVYVYVHHDVWAKCWIIRWKSVILQWYHIMSIIGYVHPIATVAETMRWLQKRQWFVGTINNFAVFTIDWCYLMLWKLMASIGCV